MHVSKNNRTLDNNSFFAENSVQKYKRNMPFMDIDMWGRFLGLWGRAKQWSFI